MEKLIRRRQNTEELPVYFGTIEVTYHVIKPAYTITGHGGRDRMIKLLAPKFANVTIWAIATFKSYCTECQLKKEIPVTTGLAVRPILFLSSTTQDKWIYVYV